jgi:hypothetical protein
MTQITYIKSSLRHSSALTTPEVALTQFGLWKSIKRAFKKYAKPLAAIVGIAASIAVPFIAPAVAGVIFGGTALASGAIGAAIAGAGLGAAAGALTAYGTGQSVLMGAGLGLLGGGLGGGISGFTGSGGAFLGSTADAIYGSGMAASALTGPGAGGLLASALPGSAGAAAPGTAAAGTAGTTAATTASTGIGSRLLEATLKAGPGAVGTLVSSLAPSDVGAATAELKAEMERLQNSDINAYNNAKVLYDQLFARYMQIDSTAAARLAEADVQMKTAGLISGVNVARGAASAEYAGEAEKRRLGVQGSQEASGAFTDTYYQGEGAKTQALAGLSGVNPRYSSSSGNYLANRVNRAEEQQAGLGADIAAGLTPYTLALAPRDTTVTSEDYDRLLRENDSLRRRRLTEDSLTGA